MQEQDRSKESPIQFPKVSKEVIEKLFENMESGAQLLHEAHEEMENNDPFLHELIRRGADISDDQTDFFMGADFVFTAFKELEKDGIVLPSVSLDTVKTTGWEASSTKLIDEVMERDTQSLEDTKEKL